jgi:hypothetical protein
VLPNLSPCVLRGLVNIPSTESSVPGPFGVASIIRGLPHSPSWPCIAGSARLRAFLQSPASADPAFIWQDRQTIRRTLTTPNNMGGLGHVVIGNSNSISINSQNPISVGSFGPPSLSSTIVESDAAESVTSATNQFEDLLSELSAKSRWQLSSGRYVEEILREAALALSHGQFEESTLPSLMWDLSDTRIPGLVRAADLQEVQKELPPVSTGNEKLARYSAPLIKIKSLPDVVRAVARRMVDGDAADGYSQWVDRVVCNTCHILSAPSGLLERAHAEDWYNMQIWSHVIHAAFFSHPSIMVAPGETTCRASSRLLNMDRSQTKGAENRQKSGPKMDGIIRSVGENFFEFGAIESGKTLGDTNTTKWISDGLKLKRVMRDMLVRLHEEVDEDAVRHVQTVGILTSGLRAQLFRCWAPRKGGVVVCETVGPVHEFPRNVPRLHRSLWPLLEMVSLAVEIVEKTWAIVEEGGDTG